MRNADHRMAGQELVSGYSLSSFSTSHRQHHSRTTLRPAALLVALQTQYRGGGKHCAISFSEKTCMHHNMIRAVPGESWGAAFNGQEHALVRSTCTSQRSIWPQPAYRLLLALAGVVLELLLSELGLLLATKLLRGWGEGGGGGAGRGEGGGPHRDCQAKPRFRGLHKYLGSQADKRASPWQAQSLVCELSQTTARPVIAPSDLRGEHCVLPRGNFPSSIHSRGPRESGRPCRWAGRPGRRRRGRPRARRCGAGESREQSRVCDRVEVGGGAVALSGWHATQDTVTRNSQ